MHPRRWMMRETAKPNLKGDLIKESGAQGMKWRKMKRTGSINKNKRKKEISTRIVMRCWEKRRRTKEDHDFSMYINYKHG